MKKIITEWAMQKEKENLDKEKKYRKHRGFENPIIDEKYTMMLSNISRNIEELRKSQGWTQMDMVRKGFDLRFYQRLESGKHSMSLYTIFLLSEYFRRPVCDLFKIDDLKMDWERNR